MILASFDTDYIHAYETKPIEYEEKLQEALILTGFYEFYGEEFNFKENAIDIS